MAKFRKKPVVIEAVQLPTSQNATGEQIDFIDHAPGVEWSDKMTFAGGVIVQTLEGDMRGDPGDWLIRGVKGEYYPCKPDIFEATYEPVTDDG